MPPSLLVVKRSSTSCMVMGGRDVSGSVPVIRLLPATEISASDASCSAAWRRAVSSAASARIWSMMAEMGILLTNHDVNISPLPCNYHSGLAFQTGGILTLIAQTFCTYSFDPNLPSKRKADPIKFHSQFTPRSLCTPEKLQFTPGSPLGPRLKNAALD